ncbi:MAG TPA: site-2 protease family protein [Termitinemataceae bacterium]|jgi:regulator of sigma E protease|uniref:site-2 protease family protein n=1 Tax=Treponema sp. J25 TaxID=2094121 RepID=UPI00104306A5|nr:site-2 protease family protein [Treponema sp. J25]TCW60780.1 RIP metalloprotease RseP [Treponema sp. J25]HOJ98156.1 site-2 protease family protein [Termitinemataceae bacterium]HOM22434.1 site-2 protease family protein [Termitinemataceae bacterium]HPP99566.1 site-2 protease family protein [Termitinemataceae bacterium]
MIVKILVGLVGLGIVVFVHELGHFLAARLVGIDVEAFSIGWGKPLWKRKIGQVEYRIGVFPVGGYCKMKGEDEFKEALTHDLSHIPRETGSFYGASPWRRIIVALAGPFFNALFAVCLLSIVWGIGFTVHTMDNRIVLASDIDQKNDYPANQAGLKTGDRITAINGKTVTNALDIQEWVSTNPGKTLNFTVEREGSVFTYQITPQLDPATGSGKIGIYFWGEPRIAAVAAHSAAAIGGLQKGDRILQAAGEPLPYSAALYRILKNKPEVLPLTIERNGTILTKELVLSYDEGGNPNIGISFEGLRYRKRASNVAEALWRGTTETIKTLQVSVKSLAILFRGVDLSKALSGPVRITYMVGDVATESIGEGFETAFISVASFLALISISLAIMNLLPIPALDGGLFVLFLIEGIFRKPLHPKLVYAFQMLGTLFIFTLLIFSLFGDVAFLFKQ